MKCVFCDIVRHKAPATILDEWSHGIAIEPLNPVTPGHVLIIPKVHVEDFMADPEVGAAMMEYAADFAFDRMDDVNLITSKGSAATQTVFHLHLHLVPRHHGDGLKLPWTGQHG